MPFLSSTIITADTPAPTCHDATLVLEIPITSYEGPIAAQLPAFLADVLRDWRDGRYPFHVEMLKEGLQDCIKRAANEIAATRLQETYGREMVVSDDGRSQTARWLVELQKTKVHVPYMRDEITVRMKS